MSYVPGFASDVFVSYSAVDNEVLVNDGGQKRGWVDMLLDKVRREMKPRLGGRDVSFLIDHEIMRANRPITPQILDAVRDSATLLIILSPSYLASEWCQKERNTFLAMMPDRVASGSVLVVRARPVDDDDLPHELRDLRGIELFTTVPGAASHRPLGYPSPDDDRTFADRVLTLSGELTEQLQRLRAAARRPSAPPSASPGSQRAPLAPPTGQSVFVASSTEDLEDREQELRNYLKQAGLDVLPSPLSRYPTTSLADHEAAVLADMERCCLFVQLLSGVRGKEPDFAPGKRMPALQHDLARRANRPVIQWRERELQLDSVRDPDQRALLEGAQACGIEELKRTVVERARQERERTEREEQPSRDVDPSRPLVVFVDAASADSKLADEIATELGRLGAFCMYPIDGDPESPTIRADLENHLRACDGLVLVYGKEETLTWARRHIYEVMKNYCSRGKPISTMVIYDGPPPKKPDLHLRSRDLVFLDCRRGVDRDKLREFVERLRT